MLNPKRSMLPVMLLAALGLGFIGGAIAQPTKGKVADNAPPTVAKSPLLPPKPSKIRSFFSLLDYLAERYNVTLIAEDAPLKTDVSEAEAQEWISSLPEGKTLPVNEVDAILTFFDYDLLSYQENVYLLKKRFTDPLDFPCVTLPEWTVAIEDVQRLMEPYSPAIREQFSTDERIRGLCQSFTAEQRKAMREEGVPVSALNEANQKRVRAFLDFFAIESKLEIVSLVATQSRCVLNDKTRFGWFPRQDAPEKGLIFGYEGPMTFPPCFGPMQTMGPGATARTLVRFRALNDLGVFGDRLQGQDTTHRLPNVPMEPTPLYDRPTPKSDVATRPNYFRLDEIADRLNSEEKRRRAISPSQTQEKPFIVHPALVEKRVTVAGLRRTSPGTVFYALSKVYGLRVKDDALRSLYSLERLRVSGVSDRSQLNKAVTSSLPQPFLRAAHLALRQAIAGMTEDKKMEARRFLAGSGTDPGKIWFLASIQRLQRLLKERLGELKSVPASQLNEAERLALSNSLMANAKDTLSEVLVSPEPHYLAHFDKLVLKGGDGKWPEGTKTFSIKPGVFRKNRTFESYISISLPAEDLGLSPIE